MHHKIEKILKQRKNKELSDIEAWLEIKKVVSVGCFAG